MANKKSNPADMKAEATRPNVQTSRPDAPETAQNSPAEQYKPLGRNNFLLMGVSALMIVLGFILISGPATTADAFNEDIFSTRRIVVGPFIAFLGFVLMAVAIIVKPRFGKTSKNIDK